MWRHFLVLGLFLIMVAGYLFWTSHRQQDTAHPAPDSAAVKESGQNDSVEIGSKNDDNRSKKREERSQLLDPDLAAQQKADDEYWKKRAAILGSPEYAEFLETEPTSLYARLDFLKSQGLPIDKNAYFILFDRIFRENFPDETPASAEPQLRQELVNRLNASDTDDDLDVVMDFIVEEKHSAWGSLYFETDSVAYSNWVMDVLNNHQLTAAESVIVEVESTTLPTELTESDPADERSLDDIPTTPSEKPPVPGIDPPILEADDVLTESGTDIDAEFRKMIESTIPEALKLPTLVEFEKNLRENFAPNRFNAAIQTLNRYGPEDGLRRLKASDPEVAKHFERLIQAEQEN